MYPEYSRKYDEVAYAEKNRDRYEYREYRVINDASFVSKTEKKWPFLKSVGYVEQTRILIVRDEDGNDITPSREKFLSEGSPRQPSPGKGDQEGDDIQIVGIISDRELSAKEMGKCKRDHWSVENRLHHVLDDTFREDRSTAKKSRNNLALIRIALTSLLTTPLSFDTIYIERGATIKQTVFSFVSINIKKATYLSRVRLLF